jgi:hypothetical protein
MGNTSFQSLIEGALRQDQRQGVGILVALAVLLSIGDELVNNLLTSVHFTGVAVDLGQLEDSMLVLCELGGAQFLIQLDEALPCLGIFWLDVRRRPVCGLGI